MMALWQDLGNKPYFTLYQRQEILHCPMERCCYLFLQAEDKHASKHQMQAAAIRGSALFIRYNPETDTTILGALTSSGIEISNQDGTQNYGLQAGQLMVVVKGQFQGLYDFDLRNFYETSDLVRGLNLTKKDSSSTDEAIASVQAETSTAIAAQLPITGQGVVENPSFLQNTASAFSYPQDILLRKDNSSLAPIRDNFPVNSIVETGQILRGNPQTGNPQTGNPQTGNPQTGNPQTGNPQTGNPQTGNQQTGNQQGENEKDKKGDD